MCGGEVNLRNVRYGVLTRLHFGLRKRAVLDHILTLDSFVAVSGNRERQTALANAFRMRKQEAAT